MCDNPKNVINPNYSINSVKDFFGGSDPIRVVIVVYIVLSFIFNTIIFVTIGFTIKLKKIQFPIATWIMLLVLLMNFFHTFTYLFEWVIKKGIETTKITIDNNEVTVGGLLVGNPNHIFGCQLQGFLLIFTSISQDFLINLFFFLVNSTQVDNKKTKLYLIFLGIVFPFIFTLILVIVGAIGINDQFCYVKKFKYEIFQNENGESCVNYYYTNWFQPSVIIVYVVRMFNFFVTIILLKRIWSFVREKQKPTIYLFKSIFIPIIQLLTVFIGVFYRFINLINSKLSAELSGPYLILNTVDGVLFPIGFAFQNGLITQIVKLIKNEPVIPDNEDIDEKDNKALEFIPNNEANEDEGETS